jgi:quercetin dioxygenase-like cupin family protein
MELFMSKESSGTPVRRIVTGHDRNKVAKVVKEGPPTFELRPFEGALSRLIWSTDAMPVENKIGDEVEDMGSKPLGLATPRNGTRFTVVEFAPGNHVYMHRTSSMDYVVVISGELDMDMDDSTVKLKAGDVIVQRGTNHAWANRSNAPARLAVVMVEAKPLED